MWIEVVFKKGFEVEERWEEEEEESGRREKWSFFSLGGKEEGKG